MRSLVPVALAAALFAPAPALGWSWPVSGSVLTGFAFDRAHPYAAGQHRGIDIGAAEGVAVSAPVSGTVSFAGSVPSSGRTISIETSDGYSVTLVHLGSYSVRRGQQVAEHDVVGTVGSAGADAELPGAVRPSRRARGLGSAGVRRSALVHAAAAARCAAAAPAGPRRGARASASTGSGAGRRSGSAGRRAFAAAGTGCGPTAALASARAQATAAKAA